MIKGKGMGMENREINFQFVQVDLMNPPPEPDRMFLEDDDGITLRWGGYDYFIDWTRLKTKEDILRWLCHLGEKGWKDMDVKKVVRFIQAVYRKRNWKMYP